MSILCARFLIKNPSRRVNDDADDVYGSSRDARGKGQGAAVRTMDECAVEREISR